MIQHVSVQASSSRKAEEQCPTNKEKLRIDLLRRKTWERRPNTRPSRDETLEGTRLRRNVPGAD
jgi:hypothetical protein